MALQKQVAPIPVKGLDTKVDPKNAAPGTLTLVENMHFKRRAQGGLELIKRYGGTALGKNIFGGGTISAGQRVVRFESERLLLTDSAVESWSPEQTAWLPKGGSYAINIDVTHTSPNPFGTSSANALVDVAFGGGLICAVTGSGHVTVIDQVTGTRFLTEVDLGFSGSPVIRVVALASVFMILAGANGGTIVGKTIAYTAPSTISGSSNAITDGHATLCNWDVVRNGSNDSVIFAYRDSAAAFRARLVSSAFASTGTASFGADPSMAVGFLQWDLSDGKAYAGFAGSTVGAEMATITLAGPTIAMTAMDATLTTGVNQVAGYRSGTTSIVFLEMSGGGTSYNTFIRRWPGSGTTTTVFQRSLGLGAKCFTVGSRYYLPCLYQSPLQSTSFILDVTGATPVVAAKALYGQGGSILGTASALRSCAMISSTQIAVPAQTIVENDLANTIYCAAFLTLTFSSSTVGRPALAGKGLIMPGSVARSYDGLASCEAGFHLFPETPGAVQAGGGSLTSLGTYSWVIVYQWFDSRGQRHRSAPSAPVTATLTTGNQKVNLSIPTLRVHEKPSIQGTGGGAAPAIYCRIYRTLNAGTTYYLVGSTLNDATSDTVPFTDSFADTAISSSEILYTDGGVLPNIPLPPARFAAVMRNRTFLAGTDDPDELWVLNEGVSGEGISGSDALVIAMQHDGSGFAGLAEMDDRLIIFRQRGDVFALSGNGPALNGSGQFDQPQRIASGLGTIQTAGIVKYRDGIAFKTSRGIFAITRGGQAIYIGAAVEGYNSLNLTGAAVVDDLEQIRFTTDSGRTLVYHYGLPDETGIGVWSTYVGQVAVDCTVWNGTWVYVASDGTVTEEVAGQYSDNAAAIAVQVQTAWLNLAQMFGRFRLYGVHLIVDLLGATFTLATTITSRCFGTTTSQVDTNVVTSALTPPLLVLPVQGRVEAIEVIVAETSATQGFSISALGLEVGIKSGAEKAPAGQFLS